MVANGYGKVVKLWTPHQSYLSLGKVANDRLKAYRALFRAHLDGEMIDTIRQSTNQGMALGSELFKEQVSRLAGRRVAPLKRGPKSYNS